MSEVVAPSQLPSPDSEQCELRELEGGSHNVKVNVLAPVLTELFAVANESGNRKDWE